MEHLNDFECPAHGVFEAWGSTAKCPKCGLKCHKAIRMPGIVLPGTDPGFPRAWRRWADQKEAGKFRSPEDSDHPREQ